MKRRDFVKGMSAAVAAGVLIPNPLHALGFEKVIGIQLYTLRDLVNEDFIGTLQKIRKAGYNMVEAAGYSDGKFYGYSPAEYRRITIDMGFFPKSSHSSVTVENAAQVAEDTSNAGASYLVLPSFPRENRTSLDGYKKAADDFNKIGEACRDVGLRFGYHNHAFEFEKMDDQIPYDILLERTDPDLVCMQIDLYWMVYGGYDPLEYFKKYPDRFELWHMKDMAGGESRESTEIGSGILDFTAYFRQGQKAGLQYYFVEQESFAMDPIESITKSYDYLNSLEY
nr:sugar phosphate isomerase/epimerase [Bacteroidota bacterium]